MKKHMMIIQFLDNDIMLIFGIRIFILIFILYGHKYLWFCGSSSIFLQSLQVHCVSDTTHNFWHVEVHPSAFRSSSLLP